MNDKLFKEYKEIKEQLILLEDKRKEIELQIMDSLDSDGQTQKVTPFGMFAIMGRKTYEYSSYVKTLAVELSKTKKIEELNGTASLKSDSRYLRLVTPKEVKENE